ncbi:hypothetical protein FXO38_32176 [Capsicum annuum]|nr:hypothetical protein FXO38_32176 [Capsicum annuum]KAF3621642.1 hypothetical protein FXO37_32686 [Capsicum annuum]
MEVEPKDKQNLEEILTSRENSTQTSPMHGFALIDFDYPMAVFVACVYSGFRKILLYVNSSLFFRRGKIVERNESCIPVVSGEGDAGTKSEEKSPKKVRFSMKNNLVWKPNSPMPPQDFTVATYAYSPRQCFEERSASWPHKRSASLHEEDETEKERPQDTKDRFPRHEAAEKDESYVFLVNFKLTGLQEGKKKRCHLLKKRKVALLSIRLGENDDVADKKACRLLVQDSSFVITDFPKKSPHISCYVEMKIFDTLKQKLSGVQFRRFMGTCFDQYATMPESWVQSQLFSHGKGIPPRYFDAEVFPTLYAALLCKHETQKNESSAVSDDENPDKSVRPQFECESSDMIIIP